MRTFAIVALIAATSAIQIQSQNPACEYVVPPKSAPADADKCELKDGFTFFGDNACQ